MLNLECYHLSDQISITVLFQCPDEEGWSKFQSSCYLLSLPPKTWVEADELCANAITGGHLVHIESEDEQDFVVNGLLPDLLDSIPIIEVAWFGLRRVYEWSDGSPQVVASWQNILTNEDTPCFRMHGYHGETYQWWDTSCETEFSFLCEIEGK